MSESDISDDRRCHHSCAHQRLRDWSGRFLNVAVTMIASLTYIVAINALAIDAHGAAIGILQVMVNSHHES
jgi:hypothetical protein